MTLRRLACLAVLAKWPGHWRTREILPYSLEYQRSFPVSVSSHSGGEGRGEGCETRSGMSNTSKSRVCVEQAPLALVDPACERVRVGDVSKERRQPRCRAAVASPADDQHLEVALPVHLQQLPHRRLALLKEKVADVCALGKGVAAILYPKRIL